LWAMVASLVQSESVELTKILQSEGRPVLKENVHERLFIGVVYLGASTAPSPLLACRTPARAFSVLVLKPTAPSCFFTKSLHSDSPVKMHNRLQLQQGSIETVVSFVNFHSLWVPGSLTARRSGM
jgi:hypothetical protein